MHFPSDFQMKRRFKYLIGKKAAGKWRTSCWSVVRKPQQSRASSQVITVDERHWFLIYLWKRVCWQTWASLECGWEMPGPSEEQQVAGWVNRGCVKLGRRTQWGRQVHMDRKHPCPVLMGPLQEAHHPVMLNARKCGQPSKPTKRPPAWKDRQSSMLIFWAQDSNPKSGHLLSSWY